MQVTGLTDVVEIATADSYSLAMKADGTVWGWGDDVTGTLQGSDKHLPQQIMVGLLDSNSNGMDDRWELQYFGNLDELAEGDFDGDGVSNLEEFLQGTDPKDYYNGVTPVIEIVSGNNQLGDPGTYVSQPLTVRVRKTSGELLSNAPVDFTVPSGSGGLSLTSGGTQTNALLIRTGVMGLASAYYALPPASGISTRVTAATAATSGPSVSKTFRVVSKLQPPPTPTPDPSASPTPTPTAPPLAPYRYAIIDLGKDIRPIRVNNNGWVLLEGTRDGQWGYFRWKGGVFERLTYSDVNAEIDATDMNDEGVVVGWFRRQGPWENNVENEIQGGLKWSADNSNATKVSAPAAFPTFEPQKPGSVREASFAAINNANDIFGDARTGAVRGFLNHTIPVRNGHRWPSGSGTAIPLSDASAMNDESSMETSYWSGSSDSIVRASSAHYIGRKFTAASPIYGFLTGTETGMINGQASSFDPDDLNEEGIVVGSNGAGMIVHTPGSAELVFADTSPIAINDYVRQPAPSPSPQPTPALAPQIISWSNNALVVWERQQDGQTWHPFGLEEMIPSMDGWESLLPDDMNDQGIIVGESWFTDPTNPAAQRERHGFLLLPVDVKKVWSDQLAGVTDANYLPNKTGQGDRPYLLMGAAQSNNFDLKGHLKVKVNIAGGPELRDKLLWRLAGKSGSTYIPENGTSTYNAGGDEATIVLENPRTDEENSYFLVAGYDLDGNAQLSASEVNFAPKYGWSHTVNGQIMTEDHDYEVKIVARSTYDQSQQRLTGLSNTWDSAGLSQASRLLTAFLTETSPTGATSQPTPIARDEKGLTHAVGVLFQPPGNPGVSIGAQFAPVSQMSATLLESQTLKNWLSDQFETKRQEVDQRFLGTNNAVESFIWQFTGDLSFSVVADPDLFFALGKTTITVTADVEVHRALYEVQATALTGSVIDLTDFDYDDRSGYAGYGDFVRDGARVQAGYNTLGIAGRVFKNNVQMFNSPVSIQFRFQ